MNECPVCNKAWTYQQTYGVPQCPRVDYKCSHCDIWIAIYRKPFYVMILHTGHLTHDELKAKIQIACTPVVSQLEMFTKGELN